MLHHIDCQFINMEKVSPVFYRKTEPFIPTHDNMEAIMLYLGIDLAHKKQGLHL